MACQRSITRLAIRQLTRPLSTPLSTRTAIHSSHSPSSTFRLLSTNSRSQLHTSRTLSKQEDSPGSADLRPDSNTPGSPAQKIPPKDPSSNDAYPDGPPGAPKSGEHLSSGIAPSTVYSFEDIQDISNTIDSNPHRILIDVREQGELLDTGRIPGALHIPIKTAPDAFFMSAEDFEDKYGFARPGEEDEVIFYCKAGVRSKAAARLAGQAGFGGRTGEFPGSIMEWIEKGGKMQRE